MPAPHQIGTLPLGEGRELRITLTTERGRPVVDVREFAPFSAAGVMMPGRNGVVVPAERLAGLVPRMAEAAEIVARRTP